MKADTSKPKAATKATKPAAAKSTAAPAPAPKAAAKAAVAKTAAAPKAVVAKVASPAVAPAPAPVPAAPAATQVPARTTRPSSRLAQLTVPSMAQAVASTAAKASYLHTMPTTAQAHPTFTAAKKDPKLANNWKTKSAAELTDAEVMAMPDSEYMNDKQMAFFRLKLVQLKQDIHNSAGETTEHLREDTVVVPDPADRATIEEEHALELRTRDRERKLLKKIEQSIARIDAGDYGYCDETGEPIGTGRLIARPTATLSLEAQQRRELKQKMFGD
ncbi:RNA polymerase-binding protein DksA [Acidovorax sp. Leaf78]|uniref:RNA polymerase-binding protein DksA n=1 Tax=unclassified Acidovorax TaxID=2684926 RepID=UPI0009E9499E|nr:RNA polymerase-binding protein DksA [Acidovorax sp. Leaf78]RZJ53660.1 MAG: RNA polymerase-binding protein DksA [Acidovorax sp.]